MQYKKSPRQLIALLIALTSIALTITCAVASEECAISGHALTVTIPDGWYRRNDLGDPVVFYAVERGIGNSLAVLTFKQPDKKFSIDRKEVEAGVMDEVGAAGKIVRRVDTKLVGVPAYCVVVEVEVQGRKSTVARIMMERPLDGFVYVVQYSKLTGGDIDDAAIQAIADRVHMKPPK